ncbi:AraC family transcriptional regulator, partial [Burkholderia cenocepacia]|nr:AraC family transcriptional regulator [Burkholderia cenocepacia]
TPDTHDLVSELLLGMRLSGVQYRRIQVARPVLLRDASGDTMRLEAGDAILLPHGGMHALVSDPDVPSREINGFEIAKICDTVASVASAGVS